MGCLSRPCRLVVVVYCIAVWLASTSGDVDLPAEEVQREEVQRKLYVELMRGTGRTSTNPITDKAGRLVGASSWPRKGGNLFNDGHCRFCPGITNDPATGKDYNFRWKISPGMIPSGIRSIVIGPDRYRQLGASFMAGTSGTLWSSKNQTLWKNPTVADRIPDSLNQQRQFDTALYVTSAKGVVYKLNRITGEVIWQFDTGGNVRYGGAAAVVSDDEKRSPHNRANNLNSPMDKYVIGPMSAEWYGGIVVGNDKGKLYSLGPQGLVVDSVDFSKGGYSLGDSQITVSKLAGAYNQGGVLIATQPSSQGTNHTLIKKCDNVWENNRVPYTDPPASFNTIHKGCGLYGWKFTVPNTNGGSGFATTPTIGPDGSIYIGSDNMYALNSYGSLQWYFNDDGATNFKIAQTAAIYSGNAIFFGAWNSKFYALSTVPTTVSAVPTTAWVLGTSEITLESDAVVASIPIGARVTAEVCAQFPSGEIPCQQYISAPKLGQNQIDQTPYTYVTAKSGRKITLSTPTVKAYPSTPLTVRFKFGANLWSYTAGGAFKSYAASNSRTGNIYTANEDGFLYALSPKGTLLWKNSYPGASMASPISLAGDGTLYFSNMALDPNSGSVRWALSEMEAGGSTTMSATAIDSDGTVYMGTEAGALYALGPPPVADPDTAFMEDLISALTNMYKDWKRVSLSSSPLADVDKPGFWNSLVSSFDFTRMPDGVTYRSPVCGLASDNSESSAANPSGNYILWTSYPQSYAQDYVWRNQYQDLSQSPVYDGYRATGRKFLEIRCNRGRISSLRMSHLLRGYLAASASFGQMSYFSGTDPSSFFVRGLSIPSSIGGLSGLTRLEIMCVPLLSIPSSLGNLKKLQSLSLGCSAEDGSWTLGWRSLGDASQNWGYPKPWPTDDYSDMKVSIPPTIGGLSSLTYLRIGGGFKDGHFPTQIGRLANLQTLVLDRAGQFVSGLPTQLKSIQGLKIIGLASDTPYGKHYREDIQNLCLPDSMSQKLTQQRSDNTFVLTERRSKPTLLDPFIVPQCVMPPTVSPPPTLAPVSAPSRNARINGPTLSPLPNLMTPVATGHSIFYTYHADQKCEFKPYATHFPTANKDGTGKVLKMNQCTPVTSGGSTYYLNVVCKLGVRRYTLELFRYSSSDCSGNHVSHAPYKHDALCAWDDKQGGFKKIRCGEDLLPMAAAQVKLGPTYETALCDTPTNRNVSHWAGVCAPKYVPNLLRGPSIAYNYILSLGQKKANQLLIRETRYDPSDMFCERGHTTHKTLTYTTTTSSPWLCKEDPLSPGQFYQSSSLTAPTFSTAAPTYDPVLAPPSVSVPTTAPTRTAMPTTSLFSANFDTPMYNEVNCTSSQYLTGLKFCNNGSLPDDWTVSSVDIPGSWTPVYAQARSNKTANEYAIVLYHDLILKTPKFSANDAGVKYSISFEAAPAAGFAFNLPFPFTRDADYIVVEVVAADGTALPLATFRYYPYSFSDPKFWDQESREVRSGEQWLAGKKIKIASKCNSRGCLWNRPIFTYTGQGSGPVSLRFTCGKGYFLCGAIDNLMVVQAPGVAAALPVPDPTPEPYKMFLLISNAWNVKTASCPLFASETRISELQIWNGADQVTGLATNFGRFEAWTSIEAWKRRHYTPCAFNSSTCAPNENENPGRMADGDLTTYPSQGDRAECWGDIQALVWIDVSRVDFDRIVLHQAPKVTGVSRPIGSWDGYRIALVPSPESEPVWQSSFPASTLTDGGRKFTFYPQLGKMRCIRSAFCAGSVNATSKVYSFGSSTTTLTDDCDKDLDCVKKYNAEWSVPRKLYQW